MHPKQFRVQIYAYQYRTDFVITSLDGPLDIENAIVDKLGKKDIKWEYLGEMMNPKIKRITYEEVMNGENDVTSTRPLQEKEGSGSSVGAGTSQGG
jgi:hypothetical protein|tara:strand:- start:45 stop:332 length:288 start_codon:yes stop_codon:yes gene_type:complete